MEEEEEESKDKWTRDPAGVSEQAGGGTVPVPHVILGREIIVCRQGTCNVWQYEYDTAGTVSGQIS